MFHLLALLFAAQGQPTFRSDVTLVRVDAEVQQEGRVVEGLGKESFLVTDAGKPQRILHFGHQDEPLDVVLLFDVWPKRGSRFSVLPKQPTRFSADSVKATAWP